jgi:hypothetical protein
MLNLDNYTDCKNQNNSQKPEKFCFNYKYILWSVGGWARSEM